MGVAQCGGILGDSNGYQQYNENCNGFDEYHDMDDDGRHLNI